MKRQERWRNQNKATERQTIKDRGGKTVEKMTQWEKKLRVRERER